MIQEQQSGIPSTITLSACSESDYCRIMAATNVPYLTYSSQLQQCSTNKKRKRNSSPSIPLEIDIVSLDKKPRVEAKDDGDFDDDILLWNTSSNAATQENDDEGSLTWLTIQSFDPSAGIGMKLPDDDDITKALEFAENDWNNDCHNNKNIIESINAASFSFLQANKTVCQNQDTIIYIPANRYGNTDSDWDDVSDISDDSSVGTLGDQQELFLPSCDYFSPSPLPFYTTIQDHSSKILKGNPVSVSSSADFGNPLIASGLVQVHTVPSLRRYSLDYSF